ncbi:zinc finger protein 2-like [Ochlerotatus camptorhynchus]|uniref:zinc finger protein 2-like n=1 Tax=Ochlerotatus camptorhynchus TaxID=644619 RepID=UPI0031E10300
MSSQIIKDQPKLTEYFQKVCRLCFSEEMLEDVFKFKQDEIIRRISDLLSIVISEDDQVSRSICTICRARLYEFHDYKVSCLEVQDVLRSQICLAVEKDLSVLDTEPALDSDQIKSELQEYLNTEENLLEEMKISPENTEQDAETVKIDHIEQPVRNRSVRQKKSGQKRYVYEYKVVNKTQVVSCSTCGKKVPKSCLQAHQDKHRLPNYKCERGCVGMKFKCRQTQLQHYVNVHDYRPLECKLCYKLFSAKSSLNYHMKSVHQLKPYQCTICNSSYPIKYLLGRHMKIHSAKMDHHCSICEYATNIKHNLTRHMLMHARQEKERNKAKVDPELMTILSRKLL